MMERLVTVRDIRDRYGCSGPTARKYLRQMFHYEAPLTAPEWALREWEQGRERMPDGANRGRAERINRTKSAGRVIVPRRRANND